MSRRLVAALVSVLLLITACADGVAGSGRLVISTDAPSTSAPIAQPACPSIVDAVAHLSFSCVDNSLTYTFSGQVQGYTTSLQLFTEPTWVAEQDAGKTSSKSGDTAQTLAQDIAAYLVRTNYGTTPTSAVRKQGPITVPKAVSAYRQDVLVTLSPAYRKSNQLTVQTELLSVSIVEVSPGSFSSMLMSVPDTQKSWWANYDATVASLSVN